ncbi:MAG: extracellular solute-binding protein [Ruminococcaceae bacterium]|nr:extracellular solute-binding protein [Oscillospiraceae bacterium]
MKRKGVIALALTILLVFSLISCADNQQESTSASTTASSATTTTSAATTSTAASTPGEYRDGIYYFFDPVEIDAMIGYQIAYASDATTPWFFKWVEENMNITFNIESVPTDSMEERTSLVLSSGDLPDCFMVWLKGIRTRALQAQYGDIEKLLLPLNDLITPEIMPTLTRKLKGQETAFNAGFATLAGNIYTFPRFLTEVANGSGGNNYSGLYYNKEWFAAVGYDVEEDIQTVYDLRDALKLIKEQDPGEVGEDLVPLGGGLGSSVGYSYFTWFLNAFGFGTDTHLSLTALRDGDLYTGTFVFIPMEEAYYAYLEYMNSLYEEGLMEYDVFTIDDPQVNAKIESGYYAVHPGSAPYSYASVDWTKWTSSHPLKSDFQDEYFMSGLSVVNMCYYMYMTTDAEDIEALALAKMMDYGYDEEKGYLYTEGPQIDVDETYDLADGWYFDEDGFTMKYAAVENKKVDNSLIYKQNTCAFGMSGARFDRRDIKVKPIELYDPTVASEYFGLISNKYKDYTYQTFTGSGGCLFDEETSLRMTDLETLLLNHYNSETAKFITGIRKVTPEEFKAFQDDLLAMGMQEYMDTVSAAFHDQYR